MKLGVIVGSVAGAAAYSRLIGCDGMTTGTKKFDATTDTTTVIESMGNSAITDGTVFAEATVEVAVGQTLELTGTFLGGGAAFHLPADGCGTLVAEGSLTGLAGCDTTSMHTPDGANQISSVKYVAPDAKTSCSLHVWTATPAGAITRQEVTINVVDAAGTTTTAAAGTTTTAAENTGSTCYESPGNEIAGCTCDSSCATCGYNDAPTENVDCIKCKDETMGIKPIFPDGTGSCVDVCDITLIASLLEKNTAAMVPCAALLEGMGKPQDEIDAMKCPCFEKMTKEEADQLDCHISQSDQGSKTVMQMWEDCKPAGSTAATTAVGVVGVALALLA